MKDYEELCDDLRKAADPNNMPCYDRGLLVTAADVIAALVILTDSVGD